MTSSNYCAVKGKDERRRGVFGNKLRSAEKIMAKQKNFKSLAMRTIKEEVRQRKELRISEKLLEILPKMLEESPESRITAD
jgi:hypothetical protein